MKKESQISNGARDSIQLLIPYQIKVRIKGVADYLFHRFNCEDFEEKSNSRKGSAIRKTHDLENLVYRDEKGFLALPSEQFRMSVIAAAKYKQDPRSPRKSAMDLFKASVICLNQYSSLNIKKWDYEDKRRVVVNRASIPRIRPAIKTGWEASFAIQIQTPDLISKELLLDTIENAGKLCGIGDFRPTYGRFQVIRFEDL